MKEARQYSTLVSHNVTIDGRRTSVRLEPDMWQALKDICSDEKISIHEFCSHVNESREQSALTAAIRVAILAYYREKVDQLTRRLEAGGPATGGQNSATGFAGEPLADPKRNGAPMHANAKPMR